MSGQAPARLRWVLALAIALVATTTPSLRSAASPQALPALLSLATVYTPLPDLAAVSARSSTTVGSPLSNSQRWYVSFLTQQRVICAQVDELRSRLRANLIGTEEFLDRLDPLLKRADRLYTQWKRIGATNAERLRAREGKAPGRTGSSALLTEEPQPPGSGGPDSERRDDAAVGKSLNYLRLSLVNLFLGYADSNGRQIADAERQASLSGVWRSKSLSFINALEPCPAQ